MRSFEHSIDVLVKAYLNDTLEHGNCAACAVGNLIADARGYKYRRGGLYGSDDKLQWEGQPYPNSMAGGWFSVKLGKPLSKEGVEQIKSTGYSEDELLRIEEAFESVYYGECDYDYMYNGLMAVVDVLADIHKVDLESVSRARELFVRA